MVDHLLESSEWDDSNKWSTIGLGEEIGIIKIEIGTLSGALNNTLIFFYIENFKLIIELTLAMILKDLVKVINFSSMNWLQKLTFLLVWQVNPFMSTCCI